MKRILLVGGGGHCRSIIDTLISSYQYDEIGIIEKELSNSNNSSSFRIVGTDMDLPVLFNQGWQEAFVSLGSVGNTEVRRKLFQIITEIGFIIPNIIDKTAIIASEVEFGNGIYIGKRVVINTNSNIKDCSIINTGSIIEHDCQIGAFAHVSSGAVLCGGVKVGDDSHVGAGSSVKQSLSIGSNTLIGIGSVVVHDIGNNSIAYGCPCKVVKEK